MPFDGTPGALNAITDVPGVEVGFKTLISGEGARVRGKGPVRTGVTAIFPRGRADARGVFVEMLKTQDSGQFSYFTAHPGITRGGHYHHTKTEKFLVIKGEALFRFRHLLTDDLMEFRTTGTTPQVVDTIPGWTHNITNVGNDEMVVMLWANENFDLEKPDTVASKV